MTASASPAPHAVETDAPVVLPARRIDARYWLAAMALGAAGWAVIASLF